MGNQPSAHQPLEKGFKRARSFRFSKRERSPNKRMDRLRRSFRDSFRRRREPTSPEASRPHQWQADESAVRSGNCAFQVKYLGCTEVFESRGMQTCEEALKTLRTSKRRPIRAVLHVSGDGLRVVDDETKDLIVDQTIEKVSFCAPDRNCEKGFSYICRDGTTRRWMCHGFLAVKESGDRLSHAVGCAFAACLERKQRRDQECGVTMTFDQRTSTFTRTGSFHQSSLTERMQDPQERAIDVPPSRQVHNPYAIERPHATPSMLERQGSFRGFDQLNHASPFKRQLSLRVNDLPSNYERVRSHSLEPTDLARLPMPIKPPVSPIPEISPSGQDSVLALCQQVTRDLSLLSSDDFSSSVIKTTTTVVNKLDSTTTTTTTTIIPGVTGITSSNSLDNLKMLQNGFGDIIPSRSIINNNNNNSSNNNNNNNNNNNHSNHSNHNGNGNSSTGGHHQHNNNLIEESNPLSSDGQSWQDSSSSTVSSVNPRLTPILNQCCPSLSPVMSHGSGSAATATVNSCAIPSIFDTPAASPVFSTTSNSSSLGSTGHHHHQFASRSPVPVPPPLPTSVLQGSSTSSSSSEMSVATDAIPTPAISSAIPVAEVQPVQPNKPEVPRAADRWLPGAPTAAKLSSVPPPIAPRRAPPLHARAMSLGSATKAPTPARQGPADPFDAAWADTVARRQTPTTNPFVMLPNTTQAFQVQL